MNRPEPSLAPHFIPRMILCSGFILISLLLSACDGVSEAGGAIDLNGTNDALEMPVAFQVGGRQQLSYCQLMSPVTGVVSLRSAEAGQVVATGQTVLKVSQLGRPWVRAYLREPDLPRVKLGQPAEVRVDLVYLIKVEVDNPDGQLKIGMPADVRIGS